MGCRPWGHEESDATERLHPTLTSIHDYWKKNIALTRWTFIGKVTSLLYIMLSRFVITFLLPIFPSGCEGKLGVALESLQGLRDLT